MREKNEAEQNMDEMRWEKKTGEEEEYNITNIHTCFTDRSTSRMFDDAKLL